MLKVKFKNGFNATPVDWTPFMVLKDIGVIKRGVESDNPGEAGLIVFDNAALTFRYEAGNVVYSAFSEELSSARVYLFEIWAIKSTKEEVKIFEGIVDFTTIEWNINERLISFEVVDKIKALDLISDTEPQRGELADASGRMNCSDYLTDYIKRVLPGLGVWIEIQTFELINNGGFLERGNPVPHVQAILNRGEIFIHPAGQVGACLVTDSCLMQSMGGWNTTFVKIHPVKWCSLSLPAYADETFVTVSGNIFNENDTVYLESPSQTEFLKILDEGTGNGTSVIYNVQRHYTGGNSFNWENGSRINFSDDKITYIINLDEPPPNTHILYYGNNYYSQADINIYETDEFGRSRLAAFDALKIMRGIAGKTIAPLIFINRTGENSIPVSLNYYSELSGYSPFGKHSLEALKLMADSIKCYLFIDKGGSFVVQKKNRLGEFNFGNERTFEPERLAGADIPRKYFWDKLIDGAEARITSDGIISARASKQIFPDIKPRNELYKEIAALGGIEFTLPALSAYALETAGEYLDFYGKRHETFPVSITLYDDLLDWDLLDYIIFEGKVCFCSSLEIDIAAREFKAELVTVEGEFYYKGQANVPLSVINYNGSSYGRGGDPVNYPDEPVQPGGNEYSAEEPITITSSVISLEYEDNLKLSSNNKLDTTQSIKTASIPRFAGIAIGGEADPLYKGKFYGDIKVTGKIAVDGDIEIIGSINEVNITELNIKDKTISLNKGGSDASSFDCGLKVLGTGGALVASVMYDSASAWKFDKDISIVQEKEIKINGTRVLSSDTLGNGVINSSLTKVGIVTQGTWNAFPVTAQYINYNTQHFQNSGTLLTAKAINGASNNGMIITASFNLGSILTVDSPQDIRTASSPSFRNITLSSGGITSGADLTISLGGSSIVPSSGYSYNLGSPSKKYLSLHAAELCVETLVAQNTKATIGGRVLIGESNELNADINPSDIFIYVKFNNLAPGDIIYLETGGKVEFMKVLLLASSYPGNYEYQVQRGYDGTAPDEWYAGDSIFNTGSTGDGFIDLYSIKGIKGVVQPGPAIAGSVRNSLVYNDWSEHWAIGNLNGLYGFNSNIFGAGLGKYANNSSYVTIDPVSGFSIKHRDNFGNEVKVIELDSGGNGYFRGNITSSAVITGGVIRTAISGKRVMVDGDSNSIKFYNQNGEYIKVEGDIDAQSQKRLYIGGTLLGDGDMIILGNTNVEGEAVIYGSVNSTEGYYIGTQQVIDSGYNAYFHNAGCNELNLAKLFLSGNELISIRPAESKIMVSDGSRRIVSSAVGAAELFTPVYGELYDATADSVILCDGTNYIKWRNSTCGLLKGVTGNTYDDYLMVNSGEGGKYEIKYEVSFYANTAGDYYWSALIGTGIAPRSRTSIRASSASAIIQTGGGCLAELTEGAQVSIGCLGPAGNTVTVIYLNLRITKKSN